MRIESKGSVRGDERELAERRGPSFYGGEVPSKPKEESGHQRRDLLVK